MPDLNSGLTPHPEPVVGVAVVGREARSGGRRRPAHIVPPGAAAARAAAGLAGGGVPIEAPLVDDRAGVEESVPVRRPAADFPRTRERALRDLSRRDGVPPRRARRDEASARGGLPLGFRREPPLASDALGQERAVSHRVVPRDADDRLPRAGEARVPPPRRLRDASRFEERRVLRVGDGRAPDLERRRRRDRDELGREVHGQSSHGCDNTGGTYTSVPRETPGWIRGSRNTSTGCEPRFAPSPRKPKGCGTRFAPSPRKPKSCDPRSVRSPTAARRSSDRLAPCRRVFEPTSARSPKVSLALTSGWIDLNRAYSRSLASSRPWCGCRLRSSTVGSRLASLPSAHEPADPDDIPVEVPARVALVQVRVGDVHEPVPDDDRPRIGRRNGNRDPGPRLDEEVEARARRRRRPRRVEGTDAELDVRPDRPLGRRRIPPAVAFDGDRVGVLVAPVPVVVDGLADPQPRVDVETDLHAARNEPAEVDRRRRELRPAVPPPPEVASAKAQDRGRATPERARILRAHRGGRKEDHEEERGARGGSHAREW